MSKTRKITVSIIAAVFVLVAIIGITYAYFVVNVQGNTNEVSVQTKAGKLSLVYTKNGDDVIEGVNIQPGFTQTKSFTVTNNGTGTVEYGVFLEDVQNTFTRYEDLVLTITCTSSVSGKTCNGYDSTMLRNNDLVLTNEIDKDEVQTYNVTFEYQNANESQNDDFKKRVYGKFQIYDLESTVDLSGTVTNASSGDYVVVNSSPKRSEIVDGKFKVVGLEVGTHTINVYNESNTETPKSTSTLTIQLGSTEENISGTTVTMLPTSRIINSSIDATNNGVTVSKVSDGKILLADTIIENARNVTAEQKAQLYAEYSETPKTTPAVDISGETESTLSKALDGENTYSYYYRGNVANNYVNFSGKCWRVVRIQGDGSIKLILEDKDTTCNDASYTGNWEVGKGYYGFIKGKVSNTSGSVSSNYKYVANFLNEETPTYMSEVTRYEDGAYTKITNWINDTNNGIDKSKLKSETWCLGNWTDVYSYSSPYSKLTDPVQNLMYNNTGFYYETYKRLYGLGETANATYRCNGSNDKTYEGYVGLITADEVVFAGGKVGYSNQNYLINNYQKSNNKYFWTLSPARFYGNYDSAFSVYNDGNVNRSNVDSSFSFRPAVSLKSSTEIMSGGVGTKDAPYVIK